MQFKYYDNGYMSFYDGISNEAQPMLIGKALIDFLYVDLQKWKEDICIAVKALLDTDVDVDGFQKLAKNILTAITKVHPYFYVEYDNFDCILNNMLQSLVAIDIAEKEGFFNGSPDTKAVEHAEEKASNDCQAELQRFFMHLELCYSRYRAYQVAFLEALTNCLDVDNSNGLTPVERYKNNPLERIVKIQTEHGETPIQIDSDYTQKIKMTYYAAEIGGKTVLSETYTPDDLYSIIYSEFFHMIKFNVPIKKCKNCNKYFILENRSDAIYCDRKSPQDSTKTCKEYGAQKAYSEHLKDSEAAHLYRNIYMAKQMLTKRHNKDTDPILYKVYQSSFEKFKSQSAKWKADVKSNKKAEEEYIDWLKTVKERKVL